MRKLLILGGCYQANDEIVAYAKSQGIYTIVTDDRPVEKSPTKAITDEYWMISTEDIDALEAKCREEGIDAVICGISEYNIGQCIKLCGRLGLPFYCDQESFSYSRDKLKFRMQCDKMGVPMATYYHITPELRREDLDNIRYPVVVKPVDRNANRGISFCYNEQELIEAVHLAHQESYCGRVLAERLLEGQEYYANYAIADGQVSLVGMGTMCCQPGYPYNCYVLETSKSKEFDHYKAEINDKMIALIKSMGCKEGYCWFEFILDKDGHFYVLEMGYRLTGTLMHKSQKYVTDFDAMKWLVDCSLGVKHTPADLPPSQEKPYGRIYNNFSIWNQKEGVVVAIEGLDELTKIPTMEASFVARVGDHFTQYRHIGTLTFVAENEKDLEEKLLLIRSTLKVLDTEGNNLPIFFTDFDQLKRA